MKNNRTPKRPEAERLSRRGGGRAGDEGRTDPQEKGRSPSDAGAGNRPRPDSRPELLRVVIYPFHGPDEGIDVTDALVDAIALILWRLQGGNEPVNRLEAVVLLERAMGGRTDTSET